MEMGTLWMRQNNKLDWINSFYGSRDKMEALRQNWSDIDLSKPSTEKVYLDHGYDENKDFDKLDISDMKSAAEFRGGKCLSSSVGGVHEKLRYKCAFGHEFEASPTLVLKGGHWCPECERKSWNYGEAAKSNPFFAQVWMPLHDESESYVIPKAVCDLTYKKDY